MKNAVEKFYNFTQDCIILVRHKTSSYNTSFDIFQMYAKSFGYIFNNPVFGMTDIVQAAKIKEMFEDKEQNIDYTDILYIAKILVTHIFGRIHLPITIYFSIRTAKNLLIKAETIR